MRERVKESVCVDGCFLPCDRLNGHACVSELEQVSHSNFKLHTVAGSVSKSLLQDEAQPRTCSSITLASVVSMPSTDSPEEDSCKAKEDHCDTKSEKKRSARKGLCSLVFQLQNTRPCLHANQQNTQPSMHLSQHRTQLRVLLQPCSGPMLLTHAAHYH